MSDKNTIFVLETYRKGSKIGKEYAAEEISHRSTDF
jgi:hypothetical protein